MSASPATYILFSLAADFSLCLVLMFVWLRQRSEWQAVFWAVSQLSISAGTLLWHFGPQHWLQLVSAALALTGAIGGLWAGTGYFLGKLARGTLRPAARGMALIWLALSLLWLNDRQYIEFSTALALGSAMVWAGYQLVRYRNYYRLLGAILIARGAINLLNACDVIPHNFDWWFSYSVLIKTLTMLCVINAVQEKIQRRYTHTLDSLVSGLLVLSKDGYIREANQGCAHILAYPTPAELIGRHIRTRIAGPVLALVEQHLQGLDHPGQPPLAAQTSTLLRHDGGSVPMDVIGSAYDDGGKIKLTLQFIDVTERQKKDEQLDRAARYDALTGVLNRYGLLQQLTQGASTTPQYAILYIDLDNFQRINDCFGHAVGDQLLKRVTACLQQQLGAQDIVARLGGDEFVIIVRSPAHAATVPQVMAFGTQILRAFRASLALDFQTISLSASIGIACSPQHSGDAAALLTFAETAMYEVKKTGRGVCRLFDPAMHGHARAALVIDAALRGAIAADQLHLLYQPIVDTRTRRLKKVEALLRWQHPELGAVSPDRFIPVAEESDLIIELGSWVLRAACRQLRDWDDALGPITVSVNISPRQLTDPHFLALVREVLASNQMAAQQLELELTERVLIDDGLHARAVLNELSAMGVRISLDDFGTGYSSLSYLTQFQIDTLKIDRSFVMDIEHNPRSHNLVTTIVNMGQNLGLELVAEGIETAAQASALEHMGCNCLQGYLISRPIAAAELLRTVSAARTASAPAALR